MEVELCAHHTRRRLLRTLSDDMRAEAGERVPALSHDVHDIGRQHPASPNTSIWTGDAPAVLSPSITVWMRALVTSKRSASVHTGSRQLEASAYR